MSYLTPTDLKAFLDEAEFRALRRESETDGVDKLPSGINYAENYVKDRLSSRYNVQNEFDKTGTDRSTTLLEVVGHIAIWKLCATYPTVQIDGKRHYFYEQALETLDKIAKGLINIDSLQIANSTTPSGVSVNGYSPETELNY